MSEPADSRDSAARPSRPGKTAVSARVHTVLAGLPLRQFPVSRRDIPPDGIYLLYEAGETALIDGEEVDRIVRVGSHSGDGRLARRLGIHASGDRRGSDLRLHLGAAILARDNAADPRLRAWLGDKRVPMPEVEAVVSAAIRERFTVRCLSVPEKDERQTLEQAIIALLARNPVAPPSNEWLGRHAPLREIRSNGLWTTQHFDAAPLTSAQVSRIETLAAVQLPVQPEQPLSSGDEGAHNV